MSLRRKVDHLLERYRTAKRVVRTERQERDSTQERVANLHEAVSVAQAVAESIQNQAHERISKIVTKCLAIFDDPYEFRIIFSRARGRTEARLVFERDGLEVDPVEGSGLGVVDVAAFALRVACLVLRRPVLRRVLVLDEPFRFVSVEYRPRVRSLLETLSRELGVQFVVVTHDPQLRAGTVLSLPQD